MVVTNYFIEKTQIKSSDNEISELLHFGRVA